MSDNRPTPFILNVCTDRVNHALQFASKTNAVQAYRKVKTAHDAWQATASTAPGTLGTHEIDDDYGTTALVSLSTIGSIRLTDVTAEQRAAQSLELSKIYSALDFENVVEEKHAHLKLLRAKAGQSPILRAQ